MTIQKLLISFCVAAALTIPTTLYADKSAPKPETLRQLAYAHDFQVLEKRLDQLQEDALAGQVSYDDQRETYKVLSNLHPDLIDAVLAWRQEMPDSMHARAARIWMLYKAGWRMRGEKFPKHIYPVAYSEFRRMHKEALTLAKTSFRQRQDFIPVSDALLSLELTVRSSPGILDLFRSQPTIKRVMEQTPTRYSLMIIMSSKLPQWGGSFKEAKELCATYAPMVKDVDGYSAKICQVDTLYSYDFRSDELLRWAQQTLDQTDNPILDHARWLDAARDRPFLEGAQAVLTKGLSAVGYRDMIVALRFDSNYARHGEMPFLAPQVYSILREQALANIKHAPYDPDMLGILMKFQLSGIKLEQAPDWATWEEYLHRKIAYSPYNAELWSDYASMISLRREQQEEISKEALSRQDDYYANSVVYSNFKTEYLYFFRENKFKRLLESFPTLELKKGAQGMSKSEISKINENIRGCPRYLIQTLPNPLS